MAYPKLRFGILGSLLATMISGAPLWGAEVAPSSEFVTREGSSLFLNGREYRAIGVNMPNLHQSYFGTWFHNRQKYGTHEKAKAAMVAGIEDAAASGLKFIRFFAHPGYPKSIDLLYAKNPDRYWELMDELFALCRQHDLKLIPSLSMLPGFFPAYYGEPDQAILDPNSRTHKAAYGYIRDFVTRYRDDPTVLMWELINEAMLHADVDMKGKKALTGGVFTGDKQPRELKTREDSLTWDMYIQLYKTQTAFIKAIDPNHLVTSGDSRVRPECTSRRETFPDFKYRNDTFPEWIANNLASQPDPLDVYSYHVYGTLKESADEKRWGMPDLDLHRNVYRATHAAGSPVFIGELGQERPSFQDDPEGRWTRAFIDMAEEEGVSLIALWVWHFNWQPDRDLRSETHPLLIDRCREFNEKHAHRSPF